MSQTTKKTEKPEPKKEPCLQVQDRRTFTALEFCGHIPVDITGKKQGENVIVIYHFPPETKDDYDKWNRGEHNELMKEAKRWIDIENRFIDNKRRLTRELLH